MKQDQLREYVIYADLLNYYSPGIFLFCLLQVTLSLKI